MAVRLIEQEFKLNLFNLNTYYKKQKLIYIINHDLKFLNFNKTWNKKFDTSTDNISVTNRIFIRIINSLIIDHNSKL